jgi:hypothetical protein
MFLQLSDVDRRVHGAFALEGGEGSCGSGVQCNVPLPARGLFLAASNWKGSQRATGPKRNGFASTMSSVVLGSGYGAGSLAVALRPRTTVGAGSKRRDSSCARRAVRVAGWEGDVSGRTGAGPNPIKTCHGVSRGSEPVMRVNVSPLGARRFEHRPAAPGTVTL